MYIRKLKNGNYKFREIYKNPLTGKYQEANCTFGKIIIKPENKHN